ncbi:MAG TPA: PEP-CTERM sorting domain-containing protein [Aliidongia sp.]|uniref:PEP-CTERM sorting domain-containing protein n=1 Tax=Aliidongia sp. TaxID=1914230 RepID=UPI002DDD59E4|nr:PEP-CTERM sorting domain-containing protein [Aliidongia sp.]HEV2674543.1 PEP-CTERM sorting domain-containing protein [Aliidongia sp.]
MRFGIYFAISCFGLAALAAAPARADLIGTGTNTVDAIFYLGDRVSGDAEDEGTQTITNPGGASYAPGANSETGIAVGGSKITLTNQSTFPFCSTGNPCTDTFTGFEFFFSSGVDITGVSIDASSAADFLPVALTLVSPTDLRINLTGLEPNLNDILAIDLSFQTGGGTGPTPTPEPMSLAILGAGLAGLAVARRRKSAAPTQEIA